MKLFGIILAVLCAATAAAAPPPPPTLEKEALYSGFFAAFPPLVPADFSKLETFIEPELKLFVEGKQVEGNRATWIASLQALGGHKDGVERFSIYREKFYFQPDDRILVEEFWMPIREGSVYHPEFAHRFVSYQFKNGKLVRVDYLANARPVGRRYGDAR